MVVAALPDLDQFDIEALKALLIAKHIESMEQHRSDVELIEHLKLVIEKYRRMIFGKKSEKQTAQLEQLEFRLEELETAQAADEANRPYRKPHNRVPLKHPRRRAHARRASRCPNICRAKWSPIFLLITAAPIAAARCASSAKMSPSNWSTSLKASRSFAMCGRSSPA